MTNDKVIWDFLIGKIGNEYGVAGLMGNLYAESLLIPTNLQTSYETRLHQTDATYTAEVDNGQYTNFAGDHAGYGLAQWTAKSRKQALLKFAREKKKSIGDLQMQLDFLWVELQEYKAVLNVLKTANSIRAASDIVLKKFENPANQSEEVQLKRAANGRRFYEQFHGSAPAAGAAAPAISGKHVTVTTGKVNKRQGNGTEFPSIGFFTKGEVLPWVADAENGWHAVRLDDRVVWVSPEFSEVLE